MAFTKTVTDVVELANGFILEYGTFNDADSAGTGTLTADQTGDYTSGTSIANVLSWGFASDGDTAVLPAKDVNPNQVKITCTAGDTGDYFLIGKAH